MIALPDLPEDLLVPAGAAVLLLVAALAGVWRATRARGASSPSGAARAKSDPLAGTKAASHASGAVLVGNVTLEGTAAFPHGLRVRGNLALKPGARVTGDVTVDGDASLESNAAVTGALVVRGGARLDSGARVGSLAAEREAVVAPDATVDGRLACEELIVRERRVAPRALAEGKDAVRATP